MPDRDIFQNLNETGPKENISDQPLCQSPAHSAEDSKNTQPIVIEG